MKKNMSSIKSVLAIILLILLMILASKGAYKLSISQIIPSIISGILMGFGAFFLQWRTYNNFSDEINIDIGLRKPQTQFLSIRSSGSVLQIVLMGIIFYILGYIGGGVLFGYDFGATFFTNTTHDLLVRPLIIIFLLGMMFDLQIVTAGVVPDLLLRMKASHILIIILSILIIFGGVILSTLFFNNNLFLPVSITSRIVFSLIMHLVNPDRNTWRYIAIFITTLTIVLCPLIAFIFGSRLSL